MAIDDPLDAYRMVLDNDKRASAPVGASLAVTAALRIASHALPISVRALVALGEYVRRDRADKLDEVFNVVHAESKYNRHRLDELAESSEEFRRFMRQDFPGLLVDGCQKAVDTRSHDRVRRIGLILANAPLSRPLPDPDDVEELMRVATVLAHSEVLMLREIHEVQKALFNSSDGVAEAVEEVNGCTTMREGAWPIERFRDLGFDRAALMAIPAKLGSLGLVQQFPALGGPPYPHYMLRKGKLFIEFAKSHVQETSADVPGRPLSAYSALWIWNRLYASQPNRTGKATLPVMTVRLAVQCRSEST